LVETDTTGLNSSSLVDPVPFPLHPASVFSTVSSQKPVRALRQAIQDLHFNITVGMLSLAPELVYTQAATVIAEMRTTENVWTYDWRVLVAAYAITALLGLLSVLVGVHAMSANGGCGDLGIMRVWRRQGQALGWMLPWRAGRTGWILCQKGLIRSK
jgi:hypothetical protein